LPGAGLPVLFTVMVATGAAVQVAPALLVVASGALGAIGFVLPDFCCDPTRRGDATNSTAICPPISTWSRSCWPAVEASSRAVGRGRHRFGWPFRRIRVALETAQHQGRSPWSTLDELADVVALPALRELTSSITLAGDSGAKVRASLTAKAASLRDRQLADAHAAAERASEQMSLPVVALLVAFLLLIAIRPSPMCWPSNH